MAFEGFLLESIGLWTGVALAPFIILYLIRPKPKHETIPSLLFILKDVGKSTVNNFLRSFLKDLLFLIQLLLLLTIILAAAKPYVNVPKTFLVEQTILVVDVSASTEADRFDQIITHAEENIGSTTTIILIKGSPEVVAERVGSGKAREALQKLEPTSTTSDISGALQLASNYATTGTKVVVISDFIPTAGDLDFETALATVESKGALLELFPVTSEAENVGIIDLRVGPAASRLWVKNYNSRPEEVTLKISDATESFILAKGETRQVDFATPPGVTEIQLEQDDDFMADNTVWTSTPEKTDISLLIITNEQPKIEQSNFRLALDVISKNFPTNFNINYAIPPKVPELNHDVYVFHQGKTDFILPGVVSEIKEKVQEGASLIIFFQPDLFALDWQGLLPVTPQNDTLGGRATLLPEGVNPLTQDVEFGQVSSYFRVSANEGTTTITKTDRDPVIVLKREGKGLILYYGLEEEKASFSKDPSYPILWNRAFDVLTSRPSIVNLNVRAGNILALPKITKVKTPTGTETTNLLPLEHAGLYTLPDRTIAVNLLSDAEGDLTTQATINRTEQNSGEEQSEKAPKELTTYFLGLALLLLFVELLYVKYRGDF